jgi:hypothetical protein
VPEGVFNALLCCDRVIVENNGKKGLIGVFSQFNFPKVPAVNMPWFIYACASNLDVGGHTFTFNLAHDETQMVIMSVSGEIQVPDPGPDVEIVIPVANVGFPRFGSYTLTFRLGGDQMGSRVIRVNEALKEGHP